MFIVAQASRLCLHRRDAGATAIVIPERKAFINNVLKIRVDSVPGPGYDGAAVTGSEWSRNASEDPAAPQIGVGTNDSAKNPLS